MIAYMNSIIYKSIFTVMNFGGRFSLGKHCEAIKEGPAQKACLKEAARGTADKTIQDANTALQSTDLFNYFIIAMRSAVGIAAAYFLLNALLLKFAGKQLPGRQAQKPGGEVKLAIMMIILVTLFETILIALLSGPGTAAPWVWEFISLFIPGQEGSLIAPPPTTTIAAAAT